ncbi:MAG: hypothetical protein HYY40_10885 [Bacteroidetes bacterium]|nr:hypothetical protein [Bacteroidota bacterium]
MSPTTGISLFISMLFFLPLSSALLAQGDTAAPPEVSKPKLIRHTFEHGSVINNQTVEGLNKKTVDFNVLHRFGSIVNSKDNIDLDNLFGILSPSNINLGLNYGITNKISVGLGVTKYKKIYDLHWKYRALQQNTGKIPLSVTYYGDAGLITGPKANFLNQDSAFKFANRITYFHELMVGRKFNSHLSLQLSGYFVHINFADTVTYKELKHDAAGASFVGKYTMSPQSSVMAIFNMPLMGRAADFPKPDIGIGIEVSTGSHQFQIFLTTADAILYQEMRVYNPNNLLKKQMVIGFNITRSWNY